MGKRKTYVSLALIVLVGFFAFGFLFPETANKALALGRLPQFPVRAFKLGLDLQGGSHLVYQANMSGIAQEEEDEAMQGLRDVIERRVNLFGVSEPVVAIQQAGEYQRLIVDLPGIKDIQQAIDMIGKTPYLEFREQREEEEGEAILAKQKELQELLDGEYADAPQEAIEAKIAEYEEYLIDPYFKPTKLNGQYLKKATLDFDQTTFEPQVAIEFDDEGSELFEEVTGRNVGNPLAIYIDDALISAPRVNEAISGGKAHITGQFTVEEAKELARNLNAGALPVPIDLVSQSSIGPTLGKISLEKSLWAALFGFFGVCVFMLIFYRASGFLACLSLLVYAGIVLCLFKLIPVTLTLAGIGGAILSVGMAVDANVLIFERQKEERAKGESFDKAVTIGFRRAWPSIRDSNLTTLLVALIMFSFGTSFVKGFAVTLSLGILTSMFSALFVTRTFLKLFIGTPLERVKKLWG